MDGTKLETVGGQLLLIENRVQFDANKWLANSEQCSRLAEKYFSLCW